MPRRNAVDESVVAGIDVLSLGDFCDVERNSSVDPNTGSPTGTSACGGTALVDGKKLYDAVKEGVHALNVGRGWLRKAKNRVVEARMDVHQAIRTYTRLLEPGVGDIVFPSTAQDDTDTLSEVTFLAEARAVLRSAESSSATHPILDQLGQGAALRESLRSRIAALDGAIQIAAAALATVKKLRLRAGCAGDAFRLWFTQYALQTRWGGENAATKEIGR